MMLKRFSVVALRRVQCHAFAPKRHVVESSRWSTPSLQMCNSKFMSTEAIPFGEDSWPRFDDKDNLHPLSEKAIRQMGLTTMTEIQAKTFDAAVSGKDVLARARTGTGKTLAFLLPALERIAANPIQGQVNSLILSPTRELAAQIAQQARSLVSTHEGISYLVIFGGVNRMDDVRSFEKRVPTILVSTPGRLLDHFQNTEVRGKSFSSLFHKTHVLVLDEMDRLLDMGFRKDVEDIMTRLPIKKQTLLFSATLPPGVVSILKQTMQKDYVTVDCIHDSDPATHTNELVGQSRVIVPSDNLVMGTLSVLLKVMQDPDAKIMVFFPATKLVQFYAHLFNHGLGRKVMEIHSGKNQAYRTRASNRFREMKRGVLFTSDVSARGVDYPDVAYVVQVGMSDSRETYIHRLGRTARAGKKGHGLLLLTDIEEGFLKKLNGLDITVDDEMQALVDSPPSEAVKTELDPVMDSIRSGRNQGLVEQAEKAYRGMMGYYNTGLKQIGVRSTDELIRFVNGFALQAGLSKMPGFTKKAARAMGIYGADGLSYESDGREGSREGRASSGGRNASDNRRESRGGRGSSGGRFPSDNRRDSRGGRGSPGGRNANGRHQSPNKSSWESPSKDAWDEDVWSRPR